jgi:hypothetical protein
VSDHGEPQKRKKLRVTCYSAAHGCYNAKIDSFFKSRMSRDPLDPPLSSAHVGRHVGIHDVFHLLFVVFFADEVCSGHGMKHKGQGRRSRHVPVSSRIDTG